MVIKKLFGAVEIRLVGASLLTGVVIADYFAIKILLRVFLRGPYPLTDDFPGAICLTIALWLTIFIHELSHALAAVGVGVRVDAIVFGASPHVTTFAYASTPHMSKFAVAIAGVLGNWVFSIVLLVLLMTVRPTGVIHEFLLWSIAMGATSTINLLPIPGTDGAKAVRH
jgi:Zn-dependent protease